MNGILTRIPESSEDQPTTKTIEIHGQDGVSSVAFLVDGNHVVSSDREGKIRRWRVEDGVEVGTPMNAGSWVFNIAVSRDGKWIVGGIWQSVQVWNVENGKKVIEIREHSHWVNALDVSPDSTRIASGSFDGIASVWSLSTGQRLLGPWKHASTVIAVKFSPDGRFIATATRSSILVYDGQHGNLVVNVRLPIRVTCSYNHSLVWSSHSKHLFTVSSGKIICLDASTGVTLSQWSIHGNEYNRIALASDGAFIAASSGSSVSFWDATTHKQIGSVIEHTTVAECMAISANSVVAIGGADRITLRSLCNILPSSYALRAQYERPGSSIHCPASHVLTCFRSLEENIANLEEVVRDLRHELAAANQREEILDETINSLRALDKRSSSSICCSDFHIPTCF